LETAVWTLFSVLVGASITWCFSRRYYKKASDDLNDAAKELREKSDELKRFSILMLRAVEELGTSGTVELNRDPETGEPIGLKFRVDVAVRSSSNVSARAQVHEAGGRVPSGSKWSRFVQFVRGILRSLR
jgi:hypothetical protein